MITKRAFGAVAGSVLAGFLVLLAVPAAAVHGATLYEQLNASTLGETNTEHIGNGNPIQKLGSGLSGVFGSVAYKINGINDASGWGVVLRSCSPGGFYTSCNFGASSESPSIILSQSGNDAYILATTTGSYSFDPSLDYYLLWPTKDDMALYGAASTTNPYVNGLAQWFEGGSSFIDDVKLSDVAFRICSGAVCNLEPPDTTAPVIAESAAIATSTDTTPAYEFTSTEAGALAFSGSCSAATSSVGAGTTALTFAELAVGTYSNCVISVTDAAGNTGTLAVSPFTIEAIPPEPEPPAPARSSGGGGVIGGPLSVGYQVPYLPPPPPPTPAPAPAPEPVPPAPAPAQTRTSDVLVPAPVQNQTSDVQTDVQTPAVPEPTATTIKSPVAVATPWDRPVSEQIPMGAAIATSGLQMPSFVAMAAAMLLLALSAAMALRHSKVA